MASRRSCQTGAFGSGTEHTGRLPALVSASTFDVPPAVNDNKPPLLLRLRRVVFVTTAALTVAWLFWVGLLR